VKKKESERPGDEGSGARKKGKSALTEDGTGVGLSSRKAM